MLTTRISYIGVYDYQFKLFKYNALHLNARILFVIGVCSIPTAIKLANFAHKLKSANDMEHNLSLSLSLSLFLSLRHTHSLSISLLFLLFNSIGDDGGGEGKREREAMFIYFYVNVST